MHSLAYLLCLYSVHASGGGVPFLLPNPDPMPAADFLVPAAGEGLMVYQMCSAPLALSVDNARGLIASSH